MSETKKMTYRIKISMSVHVSFNKCLNIIGFCVCVCVRSCLIQAVKDYTHMFHHTPKGAFGFQRDCFTPKKKKIVQSELGLICTCITGQVSLSILLPQPPQMLGLLVLVQNKNKTEQGAQRRKPAEYEWGNFEYDNFKRLNLESKTLYFISKMYMRHFVFIQTILIKLKQEEYYSTKQLLFHRSDQGDTGKHKLIIFVFLPFDAGIQGLHMLQSKPMSATFSTSSSVFKF